jgi:hypothetical protein
MPWKMLPELQLKKHTLRLSMVERIHQQRHLQQLKLQAVP